VLGAKKTLCFQNSLLARLFFPAKKQETTSERVSDHEKSWHKKQHLKFVPAKKIVDSKEGKLRRKIFAFLLSKAQIKQRTHLSPPPNLETNANI
jgi:hypothetical protein